MVGKKLKQTDYEKIMKNFTYQTDYSNFSDLDLVIEAVFEDLSLKQSIFVDLEKVCSKNCVLASNTSTLDINLIGAKTKCQDRIIGLHFFSPAHVMKLLEIIKSDKLSVETLSTGIQFGKSIQKTVVVVGNCVGFVVNRVFYPLGLGSSFLVNCGIHPYHIDQVVKKSFIIPNGPFQLYDMIGIDVFYHVGRSISNGYKELRYPLNFVDYCFDSKRFGQKTNNGAYKHVNGNIEKDEDFIQSFYKQQKKLEYKFTDEEILEILFYPCVNEAAKVLEEKLVYRASDIDIASCLGMGFGQHLGGLVQFGENIGIEKIHSRLKYYYEKTGLEFFKPCEFLEKRKTFY